MVKMFQKSNKCTSKAKKLPSHKTIISLYWAEAYKQADDSLGFEYWCKKCGWNKYILDFEPLLNTKE